MRRFGGIAALVAVVSSLLIVDARAADDPPDTGPLCGADDLPEGVGLDGSPTSQLQGDVPLEHRTEGPGGRSRAEAGYNCGLELVARETLEQGSIDGKPRNATGNANLAVAGDCAFVSGPGSTFGPDGYSAADDAGGVAVIDVSNHRKPEHVRTLTGSPGTSLVSETLYAIETDHPFPKDPAKAEKLRILVTGQYGNAGSELPGGLQPDPIEPDDKPMHVYDVTDCRNPVEVGVVRWPENIHNLTISGNGRYVFATQPTQVVDIWPLFDRVAATDYVYLGNLDNELEYPLVSPAPGADLDDQAPIPTRQDPAPGKYFGHQVWTTHDGSRIFMGSQTPQFDVFTIADIGPWLQRGADGRPLGSPVVRAQEAGRGHSVTYATVGGTPWVMHAEESVLTGQAYGCYPERLNPFAGAAEPYFTKLTNIDDPEMHLGKFSLAINHPDNCDAQRESGTQASVHYHEFDRTEDARFAIFSMQNAGIRVADVTDPAHPREIAYFNPGDVVDHTNEDGTSDGTEVIDYAWGHPYFDAGTGTIWFATSSGGFWVVEVERQVWDHFGERGHGNASATGAPGTLGVKPLAATDLPLLELTPAWCTLDAVTAPT